MRSINPYYYALNPEMLAFENAWVFFNQTGKRIKNVVNDDIWDSWQQCKKLHINPLSGEAIPLVTASALDNRSVLYKKRLAIIRPFLQTIYDVINGPGFAVTFCDADGVILECLCDDAFFERAKEINLVAGAVLREEQVGSNSVSICIKKCRPFTVSGAEHYRELFHSLASNSVPLFDSADILIGVISVWGCQENANPHTIGMITASVKAIENEMVIQDINEELVRNNNQLYATLQSISDGVIYVRNKKITHANDAMLSLLHTDSAGLLNQCVSDVVISSPPIEDILQDRQFHDKQKIVLMNGHTKYNCLMSCKNIVSNGKTIGQVLVVTKVEAITKLVQSISKYTAPFTFEQIIGKSESLTESIKIALKAAGYDSRIILEGESGTGKEVFAQSIHNKSSRADYPYVAIDCGAIPKGLFESTLFGYEKGAFTGAKTEGSVGAFEQANKGTLLLDEIENLSPDMQMKLLRALQERQITRVGGIMPVSVDVRVIAATNKNLQSLVSEGTFRKDLYYRMNVINIKIPPLRDRPDDIPLLVRHYLCGINARLTVEKQAMEVLQEYTWPGNIRELYNAIERACIMASGKTIKISDLPVEIVSGTRSNGAQVKNADILEINSIMPLKDAMSAYISYALKKNGGNITKTAAQLKITRPTIYSIFNDER